MHEIEKKLVAGGRGAWIRHCRMYLIVQLLSEKNWRIMDLGADLGVLRGLEPLTSNIEVSKLTKIYL